jgi:multiple sugar transport system permease protein
MGYRRLGAEAAALALGGVLLIWSLLPVYNMLMIALDPEGDTEFAGYLWPAEASLESFRVILTESYWYVENFWKQFGNSFYVGLPTMLLTMLIASLASFAAGRNAAQHGAHAGQRAAAILRIAVIIPGHPHPSRHA